MSLVTIDAARAHLRVEPDYPADQVQPLIDGAESMAQDFLNRRVFADADQLAAAQAGVPDAIAAAVLARDASLASAQAIADTDHRATYLQAVETTFREALAAQYKVQAGIVLTASIASAIMLLIGHLDQNREAVSTSATELPLGPRALLMPYRVGWGV